MNPPPEGHTTLPGPGARVRGIPTPVGEARAWFTEPPGTEVVGSLVLGHGAGGKSWSTDLIMLTSMALLGWQVVVVEQPWRVAGRSVAVAPARLDQAWTAVIDALRADGELTDPVVVGGRSAGARVACRTCRQVAAAAVLALAFPLHPPGRPERSRASELRQVLEAGLPLLVVQGRSDAFGRPEEVAAVVSGSAEVVAVSGGHGFAARPDDVVAAVRGWLQEFAGQA